MSKCPYDGCDATNAEEHAKQLAVVLKLNPKQIEILVAELRNALVPLYTAIGGMAIDRRPPYGVRGLTRILELATAIANTWEE